MAGESCIGLGMVFRPSSISATRSVFLLTRLVLAGFELLKISVLDSSSLLDSGDSGPDRFHYGIRNWILAVDWKHLSVSDGVHRCTREATSGPLKKGADPLEDIKR